MLFCAIDKAKFDKTVIYSIVTVILILVVTTIYFGIRNRRNRLRFKELKAAGLANFEEGNFRSMLPIKDLPLDEQADLLPYDRRYEFSRDKLTIGKSLGAGAFGVVYKAIAQEILPHENESTVAVKMVKHLFDNEVGSN